MAGVYGGGDDDDGGGGGPWPLPGGLYAALWRPFFSAGDKTMNSRSNKQAQVKYIDLRKRETGC